MEKKGGITVAKEITCDVVKRISVLSANGRGYTKQLNLVSWNGSKAKLDIRTWAPDNEKSLKGITLDNHEARMLYKALACMFENN